MENEYIYFITNPYYDKNIIKIGWTRYDPLIRIKTLSNPTGVPGDFNLEYIIKTSCGMGYNLEDKIHKYLEKYRINKRREFFRIDKEDLANILVNELKLEIISVSTNNTEKHNTEENNTEENNTEENNIEENNTEENNSEENNIEKHINRKKYYCNLCDYSTFRKNNYDKHLHSIKHKNNKNSHNNNEKVAKKYICVNCEKIFNDRAGLWRHNKKCISNNNKYTCNTYNDINDKNLIMMLIKENKEIKDMMFEIMKKWNYE